ncbi:pyruvate dehydrogenase complex dihydrolipoamide acetyltransferase [bacterium SCSIO 12643]|nr:pyruvate dehydrogenase complex dihydrolipoamide acetyltransferase [bacterium SCSIO 12643]
MAEIIRMPKLSDTMTEGVVAEWHKKVGDKIESGDLIADIETDKATMEFESFQDGVLLYIGIEKGKTAPVDSILAILGEEGEEYQSLIDNDTLPSAAEEKTEVVADSKTETATAPIATPAAEAPKNNVQPIVNDGEFKASPLARKLANERGIDLNTVSGSGDNGRIVKADIDNYRAPGANSYKGSVATVVGQESYNEVPTSQMRKTIARRLSESKFSAPHFYLTIEVDMDNVIAARKAVNAAQDTKVSFNDFVVKAAAVALKKHPGVNSSWLGDSIRYNEHVNIGVAVAVEDGLLVPVVRFADTKSLPQISTEVKELAGKARDKKLQPQEWEGNTFSISNLGMYGIESFTAIINPPDAAIMAIGGIIEKPVVKNGQIVPGHRMTVTLSCDHRVVDGAMGSEFLNTFKAMLEQPVLMMA